MLFEKDVFFEKSVYNEIINEEGHELYAETL